jgi:hypothetical protein
MLNMTRCAALVLAAVVGLCATAETALAQATPIDRSGSREARKRQQEAQVEFNRRNTTVKALTARIRADFEQRDAWIKAQADLKAAQAAHEAARRPVLARLAAKPEFKKAMEAKQKAEAERDALRNSRSSDKLYEAAQKAIDANFALIKMENDALAADPKVQQTKQVLDAAEATVAALNEQLEQEMHSNAEWVEAKKYAEEAQLMVAQATKELQEASRREAEQARAQAEQARQSRRSSSGRGGRGY